MTKKEELILTRNILLNINDSINTNINSNERLIHHFEYKIMKETLDVFNYMCDKLKEQAKSIDQEEVSITLDLDKDLDNYYGEQSIKIFKNLAYNNYIYQTNIISLPKLINIQELRDIASSEGLNINFYTRYSYLDESLERDAIFGSVKLSLYLPYQKKDDTKLYTIRRKK